MAKSINEILVDYPSSSNILLKDYQYLDNKNEFLKSLYDKNQCNGLFRKILKEGKVENTYNIPFYDSEIIKILGKKQKRIAKIEKKKYENESQSSPKYLDDDILYKFETSNYQNYSTHDISFSWTLHDIYDPSDSMDQISAIRSRNDSPLNKKVQKTQKPKINKSKIPDSKGYSIISKLSKSDRLSPELNNSKKYESYMINMNFKKKSLNVHTNSDLKQTKQKASEERKNATVKVNGKSIEIPKLALTNRKINANFERSIKTDRDTSGQFFHLNNSDAHKAQKQNKIRKIVSGSTKKQNITTEKLKSNQSLAPGMIISRPNSSLKNEYFLQAKPKSRLKSPDKSSSTHKYSKGIQQKNEKMKLSLEAMSSIGKGKGPLDEEKIKLLMSLAKEGKELFKEIKTKGKKETPMTSKKPQPLRGNFEFLEKGFWTARNPCEFSN